MMLTLMWVLKPPLAMPASRWALVRQSPAQAWISRDVLLIPGPVDAVASRGRLLVASAFPLHSRWAQARGVGLVRLPYPWRGGARRYLCLVVVRVVSVRGRAMPGSPRAVVVVTVVGTVLL